MNSDFIQNMIPRLRLHPPPPSLLTISRNLTVGYWSEKKYNRTDNPGATVPSIEKDVYYGAQIYFWTE